MNLTIRSKLLAGFILVFVALVSATVFTVVKLSDTNDRLDYVVKNSGERLYLSNIMTLALLDVTRIEKNIIFELDSMDRWKYLSRLDNSILKMETTLESLQAIATEDGKVQLAKFEETWARYKSVVERVVDLSSKDMFKEAFDVSVTDGFAAREEAIQMVNALLERNKALMEQDRAESEESYNSSVKLIMILILAVMFLAAGIVLWIITSIGNRIASIAANARMIASREHSNERFLDSIKDELLPVSNALSDIATSFQEVTQKADTVASGNYQDDYKPLSDKDTLGMALRSMTQSLRETTEQNRKHNWLTSGQNLLNEKLRGDQQIGELADNIIGFLASYLDAHVGAVYLKLDNAADLELQGSYAVSNNDGVPRKFSLGEGLVGQVAISKKTKELKGVQEQQIKVRSAIIDTNPINVIITPFVFENETLGVIELGRLIPFNETEKEFVESSMESIAISLYSALARMRILKLMEETQLQSEELQTQQEELRQLNEELEEHTQNLRQQQDDLQVTNEELEEQTQLLEAKNQEIEQARMALEEKGQQLELSSRYKSEFLANMSHELRTPLNSLLILSRDLAENKDGNLTEEQVESADIINKSGYDLLNLINEVLDLSKIEAGKMTLSLENVSLTSWSQQIYKNFRRQAEDKSLKFNLNLADDLPAVLQTDAQRLDQVIKNLLSNAIKFTDSGSVSVNIFKKDENHIAIQIADTGIGIPEDKQATIFEAFQQAEGGTSRKYGGTGLGLSISRKLAELLGGEISLKSTQGEGSTFMLVLPLTPPEPKFYRSPVEHVAPPTRKEKVVNKADFVNYPTIEDDRDQVGETDKVMLIVEDDLNFATVVARQARSKGFKVLSASTGEDGLRLAARYKPNAIILDIDLPGMDGNKVLAELKADPAIRHVPVHIISANERTIEPIKEGAVEYLTKPIDKKQLEEAFTRIENFIERKMKNLLIVEDDANSRKAICKLIGNGDVHCIEAATGQEGLDHILDGQIDCVVLDLGLPDMSGFDFIHALGQNEDSKAPPIIIYTGRELTRAENDELEKYAESVIIKGVKSEERLLDETALFLHRTVNNLPASKRQMIISLYDKDVIFQGRKVLVVDDDMRNVFALSKILKERSIDVLKAENGVKALELLAQTPNVDMVLMDIMMPEMDGYEAMKRIRAQDKFRQLPIIALTAKAMKEDKQKCLDAGANDYISKPIDVERLLSLMRVWLNK